MVDCCFHSLHGGPSHARAWHCKRLPGICSKSGDTRQRLLRGSVHARFQNNPGQHDSNILAVMCTRTDTIATCTPDPHTIAACGNSVR